MLRFEKTCEACPEQYDVFDGDENVGYVRLRWGWVSAEVPGAYEDKLVFSEQIDKEGFQGEFSDENQRKYYLALIEIAIRKWIKENE